MISAGSIPASLGLTPITVTYRTGLALDIYVPPNPTGAVVVTAHGGGFTSTGTTKTDTNPVAFCQGLAALGIIGISSAYTPATGAGLALGQFPRAHLDGLCALRWVYANIRSYGGDPERIGVCGFSAGGDLLAMVALATRQGITTLGNGTSLVEAGAPYQPGPNDSAIVKRWGAYYMANDIRVYSGIGASPNPTNILTLLQCSSSSDPNYAPRSSDLSVIVLSHTGVGQPYWLAHGSSDTTVFSSHTTSFTSTNATIVTGVGHNFSPVASGPELSANLTMWAGGPGSLFGGL